MYETTDQSFDFVILSPRSVRLFRSTADSATVRLTVENDSQLSPDRSYRVVKIARAFPLSDPERYIGLRDGADKDIGMLVALDDIDETSRQVIAEELERRYFLPIWQRTIRVKEDYGIVEWEMETDNGVRLFRLRNIKDSVQHLTATRVLVTDTEGNRFEITNTESLDHRAYDVLSRAL